MVVPVTAGTLVLEDGEASRESKLEPGRAYFRGAGVEHDVVNGGEMEVVFVEVELRQR